MIGLFWKLRKNQCVMWGIHKFFSEYFTRISHIICVQYNTQFEFEPLRWKQKNCHIDIFNPLNFCKNVATNSHFSQGSENLVFYALTFSRFARFNPREMPIELLLTMIPDNLHIFTQKLCQDCKTVNFSIFGRLSQIRNSRVFNPRASCLFKFCFSQLCVVYRTSRWFDLI